MFKFIYNKINFLKHSTCNFINKPKDANNIDKIVAGDNVSELPSSLDKKLILIKKMLGASDDIIYREFFIGDKNETTAVLIYIDGMVDRNELNKSVLKPLMHDYQLMNAINNNNNINNINNNCNNKYNNHIKRNDIKLFKNTLLSVNQISDANTTGEIVSSCLSGKVILLVDGLQNALIIDLRAWDDRDVSEPQTELVVRGPRDGFTENLRSNKILIRRRLQDHNLTMETFKIGARSITSVTIAYIKDIANPKLVEEVKQRLQKIKIDAVLESGYIEQYIEDAPYSIFSTVANTERPDVATAKILEGRVAILVDRTPFVLTVPQLFVSSFQTSEDYYSRPYYASLIRSIRFLSYLLTILSAPTYVALTTYNQELIPTPLLFTTIATREAVPFPAIIEALGMIVVFEILREAGVRLPRAVGQAVSIVGALVIGEASVNAGLISAPMVIVIALTAISSFVVPAQADSAAIIRIMLLIIAGLLGFLGIGVGLIGLLIHLCKLRSFGTPYFSPFAPLTLKDLKDTFFRQNLWNLITRPRLIAWNNLKRQEDSLKPQPPQGSRNKL